MGEAMDQLHDAHVRAFHWARFAASMAGFVRSVEVACDQLAAGFAFAGQQQRSGAAAHLADVIRNGT